MIGSSKAERILATDGTQMKHGFRKPDQEPRNLGKADQRTRKERESQLRKVNAEFELMKAAPRTVVEK
jgi:hypothetical protein